MHKRDLEKRRREAGQNPNVANTKLPRKKVVTQIQKPPTVATLLMKTFIGAGAGSSSTQPLSGADVIRAQDTTARTRPRKGNV